MYYFTGNLKSICLEWERKVIVSLFRSIAEHVQKCDSAKNRSTARQSRAIVISSSMCHKRKCVFILFRILAVTYTIRGSSSTKFPMEWEFRSAGFWRETRTWVRGRKLLEARPGENQNKRNRDSLTKAKLMEDEGSHTPATHLLLKCNLTQQTELQTYTARIYMYRLSASSLGSDVRDAAICRDDHYVTSSAKLIRIETRGGGKETPI